jgi:hypothetical protein
MKLSNKTNTSRFYFEVFVFFIIAKGHKQFLCLKYAILWRFLSIYIIM